MNAAPRAVRSQLVTPQVVIGLLSLATVSVWLPSYASSVTYGNEAGEAAMSFESGDDDLRAQSKRTYEGKGLLLSRSEDSEFRLVSVSDKAVPKSRVELPAEPMKMGFDFSNLFGQAKSEPATEAPAQDGQTAEEMGEEADELNKVLESVNGLGESAAKVWGKLFGGD